MSAPRRTFLLAAVGVALIAVFAVLPAPKLIFRRSPIVSDRTAGDVRRIVLAMEPNGIMHAALEVWTDSDWDIEYFSSVPKLTPKARIVTVDGIEQSGTQIAINRGTLWLAWIDHDLKKETWALRVSKKRPRPDRNFPPALTLASGTSPITLQRLRFAGATPVLDYTAFDAAKTIAVPAATPVPTVPDEAPEPPVDAPKGADIARSADPSVYAYANAGAVVMVDGGRSTTLARTDACCTAIVTSGSGATRKTWVAWLVAEPGAAIHHHAEIRYFGPAAPYTSGGTIPVTALANAK